MSKFIEIPSLNFDDDSVDFILEERLVYQSDLAGLIIVPAGFQTDLASIPRIFQTLVPKVDKHMLPAIVHDYLVRQPDFSRRLADRVFLEAMRLKEVNRVRRRLMYWAVRIGAMVRRKK